MNYSQYDKIAKQYDSFFCDEDSLNENEEIASMLSKIKGRVYDLGCGTGLLTEIIDIKPKDYLGVDPSGEMLNKFLEKHPQYLQRLVRNTFERDGTPLVNYDWVVSLFGSISYVEPKHLSRIEKEANNYFLMFYKEDYHPVTYTMANVNFDHYNTNLTTLKDIFPTSTIEEYHNYVIVSKSV